MSQPEPIERDVMEYDVVAVGAGPAGLAFAIRLKQLDPALSVCVIEKASTIGAQILSGAVIETGPLDALLPDWRKSPPPICVDATDDEFWLLSKTGGRKLPVPPGMHNRGNVIVSLGAMCAWLAPQAEALGVEIYPGFAAAETLHDDTGKVIGVRIGDMGVARDGSHKPGYTAGIDIRAKVTVLAEGARGHLTKRLVKRFKLDADSDPQGYSIGIKELWQVPEERVSPGRIVHSFGWPADSRTYGGSFLYHLDKGRIALGYVSGLDYQDPNYQPWEAFQQWKNHPMVKQLRAGRRQHRVLRRAGDRDRRLPVAAEGGDAGCAADRRHRRPAQRAEGEGDPPGDPQRHARRRAPGCHPARGRRLRRQAARLGGDGGTEEGPQRQARLQARAVVRHVERGMGNRHRRAVAVDAEEQAGLERPAQARRTPTAEA